MKQTNVSGLKARLSEYLAAVRDGETVVVHDRRTPIARLVPFGAGADDLGISEVTRVALGRASLPIATAVKTLDALHLASALLFQERRGVSHTFATHDVQQATAARALGFVCIGV